MKTVEEAAEEVKSSGESEVDNDEDVKSDELFYHLNQRIIKQGQQIKKMQKYLASLPTMFSMAEMGLGVDAISSTFDPGLVRQGKAVPAEINYALDAETLSQFVISIPIGGSQTPMLSAEGYQHILQGMRLEVTESQVNTDPDDAEFWCAWGKVKNPSGGTQKGVSRQAKKYQNGSVDRNAYVAVHTKAIRNAIKASIPNKLMQETAIAWKNNKEGDEKSAVQLAQDRIQSAVDFYRKNWKGTLGVDDNRLWKLCIERHGKMDEWEIETFDEIAYAYRNPKGSWFADAIEFQG